MVKLSPKALRTVEAASRELPFDTAENNAACRFIEHWQSSFVPPAETGLRVKIEIPNEVASAFLLLIDAIIDDPSKIGTVPGWDQNDIAFLDSIGASIRMDLHPGVSLSR